MRLVIFLLLTFFTTKLFGQSPLCASRPTTFCCEYVSNVKINGKSFNGSNGFSSSSGGNPAGYYDYTSDTVPRLKAGQNITIEYTAVTNGNYMEYFKLWIDFNGNGVLTDAGELVHSSNYSWLGTKTVSSTFTVPTTVFNGIVYMRFVMQYSGSPTICGTYPYGNTFDFKTTITGAKDPFNHSGYVYNSEGGGVSNIPVKVYSKPRTSSTYSLLGTYNTDINGKYTVTSTQDTLGYDFKLEVAGLTISSPLVSDARAFNSKIFTQNFNSKDYYRMDINSDGRLNISDVYLTYLKSGGRPWSGVTSYYLFNSTEWTTINSSTSNLKSSLSGTQTFVRSNIKSGQSTNIYLIRTGFSN